MSLTLLSSSLSSSISRQLPRTTPVLLSHVNGALSHYNNGNPYIQKRTFIISSLISLSIDAAVITTFCAGLRRTIGMDMRIYVDRVSNYTLRGYLYRYLDFGELCADKLIQLLERGRNQMERQQQRQQSYNDYQRYRSHQHDSNDRHYRYYFVCFIPFFIMELISKWIAFATIAFGVLYVLWNITEDDEESSKLSQTFEPFIPTHEWQEVKPGQAIPPGLSVRFDFESGKNYAKLIDKETTTENVVSVNPDF